MSPAPKAASKPAAASKASPASSKKKASPKAEKEEEVRKVERIVGVKANKAGETEFLIKWTGLNPRENTWEPEAHILDDTLIDEYMKSKLVKMAPSSGKYAVGASVEVLGESDGFEYSWAPAKVRHAHRASGSERESAGACAWRGGGEGGRGSSASTARGAAQRARRPCRRAPPLARAQVTKVSKAGRYDVEFDDFMDGKKKLTESGIELGRLRPKQPKSGGPKWKPTKGELIEVFEDDCWWEGKALEVATEKKKEVVKVMLRVSDEKKSYALGNARPSCWWGKKG